MRRIERATPDRQRVMLSPCARIPGVDRKGQALGLALAHVQQRAQRGPVTSAATCAAGRGGRDSRIAIAAPSMRAMLHRVAFPHGVPRGTCGKIAAMGTIVEQLKKWATRSELQAWLILVSLILANHFLAWGISPMELIAMALGTGGYAVGRGLAKQEPKALEIR